MENTQAAVPGGVTAEPSPRFYNDVYCKRASPSATFDSFPRFSRLPAELRLRIWELFLERQRMIKVAILPRREDDTVTAQSTDESSIRFYETRNHLGKITSGGHYYTKLLQPNSAALFSPLLFVNFESRQATLRFYRVHLPINLLDHSGRWEKRKERMLYLNPDYDFLDVDDYSGTGATMVDFLHDVKAYDPMDKGVAHLVLPMSGTWPTATMYTPPPEGLHPIAAASWAKILRNCLRTVLQPVAFYRRRWPVSLQIDISRLHPTLLLHTNYQPEHVSTGDIRWLEADPRWRVERDLRRMWFQRNPFHDIRHWKNTERAFGIAQREADDEFRFYLCPYHRWCPLADVRHLHEDETSPVDLDWPWRKKLTHYPHFAVEAFQRMHSAPSTALGMWAFPPEAFSDRTGRGEVFDLSGSRAGLLLFEASLTRVRRVQEHGPFDFPPERAFRRECLRAFPGND